MNARSHSELVNVICDIDNLLRGRYKRNEHRWVIVPLTVLRRFNCRALSTGSQVRQGRQPAGRKDPPRVRATQRT